MRKQLSLVLLVALVWALGEGTASSSPIVLETVGDSPINTIGGPGPSLNGTVAYDGVARLDVGCSGSLLWTGWHILTAAHCVDGLDLANSSPLFAKFLGTTQASYQLESAVIYPGYTHSLYDPRDIAIITLSSEVTGFTRYDITRTGGEVGKTGTLVGYGGTGNESGTTTFSTGNRRVANNFVDFLWTSEDLGFAGLGLSMLASDFDLVGSSFYGFTHPNPAPGFADCGALRGHPGTTNTGVPGEGIVVPGDSGGPMLIDGQIAGVSAWWDTYVTPGVCGDTFSSFGSILNSSLGEFMGHSRVSDFASWIDETAVIPQPVPEPASLVLLASGFAAGVLLRRQRRSIQSSKIEHPEHVDL